ncbi:MAG TPA: Crp/Fnr family transcriptional regulator [Stellaceae bacterium]|nr:Crp/Fnr family transcriptional regulator [Stellaceae bacterium]
MSSQNRLITALPPDEAEALGAALEPVELTFKQVLLEPEQPIRHAHFPMLGVVSLVNEGESGDVVEVATVGREGFIGLAVALGAETMPSRAFVQIPGQAMRIEASALVGLMEAWPGLRRVLMRYAMALLNQVAQNASCNRLHEVQERCARWLLQTHDRIDGDSFPLTHEFLGQMLGVHRPTVTIAAGMLQRAGFIRYARGVITILDRAGLEGASCSCYRFIAREYNRLLGTAG